MTENTTAMTKKPENKGAIMFVFGLFCDNTPGGEITNEQHFILWPETQDMGNIQGTQFEEIFACCDPRNCDPNCEPKRKGDTLPPESLTADPVKGQQEVSSTF